MSRQTERVVYEEAVRTLEGQRELLEGLRTRAGTLLAAGFVATAFLSGQALARHQSVEIVDGQRLAQPHFTALSWIAIGLFCAVVASTLVVLIPWRWTFAQDPHNLIAYHLDPGPPSTIEELYRNLSYWNGAHYRENGSKLRVMFVVFSTACASLAAEIVVWLIVLGGA